MKHIKTTHEDETKAKKDYPDVDTQEDVVATPEVEAAARKIYALLKKEDEGKLEMSRLRAVLMNAMKGSTTLKTANGQLLASWVKGNSTRTTDWEGLCKTFKPTAEQIAQYTIGVDWEGLCKTFKPTDAAIAKFTKTSYGARRFSIELGG